MDFSRGAGQTTGTDVIPNGTLLWVIFNLRGLKSSQAGGEYLDVELTVDEGQPFERRKIWEMIGNPEHSGNSDQYRQMGQTTIARILECCNNAGPHNLAGYNLPRFEMLSGLRVPIKVGVKPAKDGYEAKNRVAEWLTPNPASGSGYKDFARLMKDGPGVPAQASTQRPIGGQATMGFGQPAAAVAPAPGGFGAPAAPAAAAGGFGGQAAGGFGGQPTAGFQQPAPQGGFAPTAAAGSQAAGFAPSATSPLSEPQAGGWLAQANRVP